ncbi:MAG: hypothetical protein E7058_03795 [Lentisphaerae bacterium]|nr:hypothetical protein [Lentisphaerota bacterium]
MNGFFDPVIPYNAIDENDYQAMIDLKEKNGIHRFLIVGIYNGIRITGYPSDEDFRKLGEKIRAIREKVEPHGIEVGWWCLPSLKTGKSPYQAITDISGRESPISTCPLTEEFAADFARRIKIVAEIARPGMILLEDDFQLTNHPGFKLGCFCPLHLKKFAAYAGKTYSRKELEQLFTAKPLQAVELRRKWAQMSHDTMVEISEKLRRALDEVSPETRLWLCEPGSTDLEGNLSEDVPRALAGKNTRPAIRIFGTQYGSSDVGRDIPSNLMHTMYSAEHLPPDFELFHESDTYPHNRYFSSAKLMESIMTGAVMIGCDSSLFIGGQYLDNHLEDFGYFSMYAKKIKQWRVLQTEIRGSSFDGVQLLYRPEFDFIRCAPVWESSSALYGMKAWAKALGRFGFPYTTLPKKVKLLCKAAVECISDAEITEILSSAVLLDSDSALALQERGFGELLGVTLRDVGAIPAVEEYILDNAPGNLNLGRRIYNFAYAPSGSEGAQYAQLTAKGAEVLTVYRNPYDEAIQPGLTRFVNKLGGKVAVMGCSIFNESSNLFNYRKKEVLRGVLDWLNGGELPAAVIDAPNMWLLFRENGETAYMMVNNLSPDSTQELQIALAAQWRNKPIGELDNDGQWGPVKYTVAGGVTVISGKSDYLTPRIFRIG